MHGATIKRVNAEQVKLNNNYKNIKLKLLKANAAIRFNKMCKVKQPKPSYINIKINGQKPQDKETTINGIRFRNQIIVPQGTTPQPTAVLPTCGRCT